MDQTALQTNLAAEMKRLGLNPTSLSKLAGLQEDYVRDIMRNTKRNPGAEGIDAIARILGRTSAQLLGLEPMTEDGAMPPLASLPPKLVQDQTILHLIRLYGELEGDDRRFFMRLLEKSAALNK